MKRMLYLCLAIISSGCWQEAPDLEGCVKYIKTPTVRGKVKYGLAYGELLFVIFEIHPAHQVEAAESGISPIIGRRRRGLLKVRRGSEETETAAQLFEFVDGKYEEYVGNITRQQLEGFLHSEPSEYSIRGLLRFVERED